MNPSILIIEDEASIADVLSYALKSEGFITTHCTLGRKGLEQLAAANMHWLSWMSVCPT